MQNRLRPKNKEEEIDDEELTYKVSQAFVNVLFAIVLMFMIGGINELYDTLSTVQELSFLLISYLVITTFVFVLCFSKIAEIANRLIDKKHKMQIKKIKDKFEK